MAGWHSNEISFSDWNKLSLDQRLKWYYKKNFKLIKNLKIKKENFLQLNTENLNSKKTLKKITHFINKTFIPPNTSNKVNVSKIDYSKLDKFEKKIVGTFYSRFDYVKAAKDPTYGADFFNKKIILGFKNRKSFIHSQVNNKKLNWMKKKYLEYLELIKKYEKINWPIWPKYTLTDQEIVKKVVQSNRLFCRKKSFRI